MPEFERRGCCSRRLRRANFVGVVQPTRMQETEAFREGEGVKTSRIQEEENPHSLWKTTLPGNGGFCAKGEGNGGSTRTVGTTPTRRPGHARIRDTFR
jgi:hypothetical protein